MGFRLSLRCFSCISKRAWKVLFFFAYVNFLAVSFFPYSYLALPKTDFKELTRDTLFESIVDRIVVDEDELIDQDDRDKVWRKHHAYQWAFRDAIGDMSGAGPHEMECGGQLTVRPSKMRSNHLGDILFAYAATYGIARYRGMKFVWSQDEPLPLKRFFTGLSVEQVQISDVSVPNVEIPDHILSSPRTEKLNFPLNCAKDMAIFGDFRSYRYFHNYHEEILSEFEMDGKLIAEGEKLRKDIMAQLHRRKSAVGKDDTGKRQRAANRNESPNGELTNNNDGVDEKDVWVMYIEHPSHQLSFANTVRFLHYFHLRHLWAAYMSPKGSEIVYDQTKAAETDLLEHKDIPLSTHYFLPEWKAINPFHASSYS